MKHLSIAAIALLLVHCAKDNGGPKTAPDKPAEEAAKSAEPPAERGIAAPTEAIGANGAKKLEMSGSQTVAETDEYTLLLQAPESVAQGESAQVAFVVVPKKGWKLSDEVDKPNQQKSDAVSYGEKEARWAINVKPTTAGKKSFSGSLKFAVCTETTCNPRKPELAFAFDVK
jgi:hypothetical protein